MKRLLMVAAMGLVLLSCSTTKTADLQVRTSFDEETDFSRWTTYRFAVPTPSQDGERRYPGIDEEIRGVIEENLSGRGYQRIEDGVPDFRVRISFSTRGDHGSDMDRRYANEPTTSTRTRPTKTNTLVVKMLDPGSSEVLWQGQVAGFNLDAIQNRAEYQKVVWRLFAEFPPITH